jgi:hypothetical protein
MSRTPLLYFVDRCADVRGEASHLQDFWRLDEHDIPETGGAYVLVASEWFVYPSGKSPVFYVGQSRNLRQRLRMHRRYSIDVRDDQRNRGDLYWPRYEYAGRFGSRYAFVKTHRGKTPRAVEEELLASFARQYRSFPVANGSGSWNRVPKHFGVAG